MSISGKQTINIGLPNESTGSDSIRDAFTKTQTNFDTLFANASPYNTFTAGVGISATANSNSAIVTITNTGVTNIIAGTNIVVDSSNGNVTISATAGGNGSGGTVTSVGVTPVSNARLTTSNSPIVASGNILIDLAASGAAAGSYTNPNLTVDAYGRITTIANGSIAGTVTSVGLTAGAGLQVNGGPITSAGNITVTNTGVLRINAGTGIAVSSGNGNVTISTTASGGTVTSVGVSSSQLVITGSPVVSVGTIGVNLPNSATFSGNLTIGGNITLATGNIIYTPRFGSFFNNANVTFSNTDPSAIAFNNTFEANGVSVVSNTRVTVDKAGTYEISASALVALGLGTEEFLEMYITKNGNTIPNSAFLFTAVNNVYNTENLKIVQTLAANDYVELMVAPYDSNVFLLTPAATLSNVAIPSATITITPVGA